MPRRPNSFHVTDGGDDRPSSQRYAASSNPFDDMNEDNNPFAPPGQTPTTANTAAAIASKRDSANRSRNRIQNIQNTSISTNPFGVNTTSASLLSTSTPQPPHRSSYNHAAYDNNPFGPGNNSPDPYGHSSPPQHPQMQHPAQYNTSVSELVSDNNTNDEELSGNLAEWESRLDVEIDKEFFLEPVQFNTLQRVIEVLGHQLSDEATLASTDSKVNSNMTGNPIYRDLRNQQQVVEDAIEHMAVLYCADLNGSVIQVGKISRKFDDAVGMVRLLRQQVRDIQDTIGNGQGHHKHKNKNKISNAVSVANNHAAKQGNNNAAINAENPQQTGKSLRELWLKKLECEAVLTLLEKLDVIRAAPSRFDYLIQPPNIRIGAAVLCLSSALNTMFSDDVAQVQALNKILEQLMLRKQKAEELIWDILHEVVYLRTANGLTSIIGINPQQQQQLQQQSKPGKKNTVVTFQSTTSSPFPHGIHNPFFGRNTNFNFENDFYTNDDSSVGSQDSGASLFSIEEEDDVDHQFNVNDTTSLGGSSAAGASGGAISRSSRSYRLMIPHSMIEAELDLDADERRCLEEITLANATATTWIQRQRQQQQQRLLEQQNKTTNHQLPRYADPILALRILVESLTQLKRLDDVERVLSENIEREIKTMVGKQQLRMFTYLEQQRVTQLQNINRTANSQQSLVMQNADLKKLMKNFRKHLTNILSSFGNILIRISHLAQILRYRLGSDRGLMARQQSYQQRTQVLHSVLVHAEQIMQREIKQFLQACVEENSTFAAAAAGAGNNKNKSSIDGRVGVDSFSTASTGSGSAFGDSRGGGASSSAQAGQQHERGLFSLGIIESTVEEEDAALIKGGIYSSATRSNVMEMPMAKFVATILFPGTKNVSGPQYKHALIFRRMVARWTKEVDNLKNELALVSGQDTSLPSYNVQIDERAIEYLDNIIKVKLLPVMQQEAVNGTVMMLERLDAFDHIKWNVYSRNQANHGNINPMDVEMCKACQALHKRTESLFTALHRLPRGGEMYLPLVAVLEHVILTFISRVKQQVNKICGNKTALRLLMDFGSNSPSSASAKNKSKLSLSQIVERRHAFQKLLQAYTNDGDIMDGVDSNDKRNTHNNTDNNIMPISPSANDTDPKSSSSVAGDRSVRSMTDDMLSEHHDGTDEEDTGPGSIASEEHILSLETVHLRPFLNFLLDSSRAGIVTCTDDELMKAACLAHSLLKLSSQLENRLRIRRTYRHGGKHNVAAASKILTSTRALREAIKTIKTNGIKMAKFCRFDMLMQTITRLCKICRSSTLVARDAVRIPSSVNELGEYLTGATDNLREAAGNAVTAYTFSSLEQYIPLCLMETVRVVAQGEGIIVKSPLTMNGIEALDRSGSVLYRDLKGATTFHDSFWDVELAAVSFERSASFIAMMELHMEELVAYYTANQDDFSEQDFQLMFAMDGPRRQGDMQRFRLLQKHLKG